MASVTLDWTDQGQIGIVIIDNPRRRNALSYGMFRELAEVWAEIGRGPARCIVVTGAAGDAFCSGADLSQDVADRPDDIDVLIDRALMKVTGIAKPLIAAVNGHAVAGGLELMLSCDLRAVALGARLGLPEAARAVFPSGGGALKLVRQIGRAAAMDLLLTGRLIDAEEALRIGLVNVVLPAEGVLDWCMAKARQIAANSPVATQAIKQLVVHAEAEDAGRSLALEQTLVTRVRGSRDAAEGRAAFMAKRAPVWRDDSGEEDR